MGDLLSGTGFSAGIVTERRCARFITLGGLQVGGEPGYKYRAADAGKHRRRRLTGAVITLFNFRLPAGEAYAMLFGLFSGVYVGVSSPALPK